MSRQPSATLGSPFVFFLHSTKHTFSLLSYFLPFFDYLPPAPRAVVHPHSYLMRLPIPTTAPARSPAARPAAATPMSAAPAPSSPSSVALVTT